MYTELRMKGGENMDDTKEVLQTISEIVTILVGILTIIEKLKHR